jgi:outer membrane protein assembly factor BamB
MTLTRATLLLLVAASAACGRWSDTRAPWAGSEHAFDVGRPVLSRRWEQVVVDHSRTHNPQEMATAGLSFAGAAEAGEGRGVIYLGSHESGVQARAASDGRLIWERPVGPTSGVPLVTADTVYVGTDDGTMAALDPASGAVRWRHDAHGGLLRPPVASGDLWLFTSQSDRIVAVDRATGKFRWQYERDMPEEFTVRGHAGVAVDGEVVYTGFADGHLVALSVATGDVLWIRSLAADARQFVDVDTTPVVKDGVVYAASVSGGVWGISKADGTERWRARVIGVTQLVLDDGRLYVASAETGLAALDLEGNVLWQQGFSRSGDPSQPVIDGTYLFLSMSERGMYIIDKRDGRLLQSFEPGPGITAAPAIAFGQLYVMSNGGILYALNLHRY